MKIIKKIFNEMTLIYKLKKKNDWDWEKTWGNQ